MYTLSLSHPHIHIYIYIYIYIFTQDTAPSEHVCMGTLINAHTQYCRPKLTLNMAPLRDMVSAMHFTEHLIPPAPTELTCAEGTRTSLLLTYVLIFLLLCVFVSNVWKRLLPAKAYTCVYVCVCVCVRVCVHIQNVCVRGNLNMAGRQISALLAKRAFVRLCVCVCVCARARV